MELSPDPRQTTAWGMLEEHARDLSVTHLRDLLSASAERFEAFAVADEALLADFSRARATPETLELLARLADELQLPARIAALFAGEYVNNTEHRAALHTSLRAGEAGGPEIDGLNIAQLVEEARSKMLAFADSVRDGTRTGHSGKPFRTVVNIGIGGSDLGPRFVTAALSNADGDGPAVRFVAGLDGQELRAALQNAEPDTTLFIVCSKTFTTLETMTNARAAHAWLKASMPAAAIAGHFAAVSVNAAAMDRFGVNDDARFPMWDWVGGRYSVWSPVGLAAAIAVGTIPYRELLQGAAAMDEHFRQRPITQNIPVLHGLLAIWHQNFLGMDQHVVLPYDQRLTTLPDYLQQLWMESLGKSVRRDGATADYPTGSSLWGNNGCSAQHSFAQWLHQGASAASVDYVGTAVGLHAADDDAHLQSLSNMLAQADVLARGYQTDATRDPLASHRAHPGNRPSAVLLLESLTPRSLGMLLALYEHSVYVQSVILGVNPFDQFGVERGKQIAGDYAALLEQQDYSRLPPIARQLLSWRLKQR